MVRKTRPKFCWGPAVDQHAEGCRPGRPKCRWKRSIRPSRRKCECGAYHFPHRKGGGLCSDTDQKLWLLWQTDHEERVAG